MRFTVRSDREIVVAFEPTAEECLLQPGRPIEVEWIGDGGMVSLEGGKLVLWAAPAGPNRAWDVDGVEIPVGPESELGDN